MPNRVDGASPVELTSAPLTVTCTYGSRIRGGQLGVVRLAFEVVGKHRFVILFFLRRDKSLKCSESDSVRRADADCKYRAVFSYLNSSDFSLGCNTGGTIIGFTNRTQTSASFFNPRFLKSVWFYFLVNLLELTFWSE